MSNAGTTLVLGGARSGKSHYAESLLAGVTEVQYLATSSYPDDPEWAARVAQHTQRRPESWQTVETLAVAERVREARATETLLVDCLAVWLSRTIDETHGWPAEDAPAVATVEVEDAVADLVTAIGAARCRLVLVSNEVGSGVVPGHASGRLYRDLLGSLNARIAAQVDEVVLTVAGIAMQIKGERT